MKLERKITLSIIIATMFCFVFLPLNINAALAEDLQKKDNKNREQEPVTILAEYLHYEQESGDVFAEGKVRIIQGDKTIASSRFDGNVKTADIWTKTETDFIEESSNTTLTGNAVSYNYNTKIGHIDNVHGKSGNKFIEAKNINSFPEKLTGEQGVISRCNAQGLKCQHITAERFDIYPNDKIIAYNVKVYLLGKKLITRNRYIISLKESNKQSLPRVGYDNDHGVYIKNTFSFPIDRKLAIGADVWLTSKDGARTMGWLKHDDRNYLAKYSYGYMEDDDNEWIKKENNIELRYHKKQLFKTPFYYRLWFERGRWSDKHKSSWHTEIGAYLNYEPIYFDRKKSFWLDLGTGYRKLKESFGSQDEDEFRYDIGIGKIFSPKWRTYAIYSNVKNTVGLFEYDKVDVDESITYNVTWSPDKKNSVNFLQQYDTENNRVYKNRISYTRNLHCWDLTIYFEKEKPIGSKTDRKIKFEVHLAI